MKFDFYFPLGYALIQIPDVIFFICDYMKNKFQQKTFSRTSILPIVGSTELNCNSNEVRENTSNQNVYLLEVNSSRDDTY